MTLALVLSNLGAICMTVSWLLAARRARRAERSETVAIAARDAAESIAVVAGDRARLHERRADEFFNIIRGIEVERDQWQKWFQESSRQAGVAQGWLFRDLEMATHRANVLAAELRKLGKAVKDIAVDPKLQAVKEEFAGSFVEPGVTVPRAAGFEVAEAIQESLTGRKETGQSV